MTSVFQFQSNSALPIVVRVTGNTATTIADATNQQITVPWFEVSEHTGATPNLTVDLYDGSNATYLGDDAGGTWNAKAMTAKQSVKFTQGIVVPKGSKLRVTSSDAAGKVHVVGVQVLNLG